MWWRWTVVQLCDTWWDHKPWSSLQMATHKKGRGSNRTKAHTQKIATNEKNELAMGKIAVSNQERERNAWGNEKQRESRCSNLRWYLCCVYICLAKRIQQSFNRRAPFPIAIIKATRDPQKKMNKKRNQKQNFFLFSSSLWCCLYEMVCYCV